ncbi:hypothetical protein JD844_028469 [Phrynosoma platyrhinos]|uniref:Bactericidal permeability-increasing protein n=1 Tax=Phrynosoma platyrhinos TaxID=52577 RepID=A0ABQ7SI55_PHRPL|nr:hypothetical protein JD844_028469 [Phrynosoma platyrhinos]
MKICSFLFLLSLFSLCLDANPGIKVKITQKGVDFGMQLGTELLKQRLKNTVFDDWHGLTGLNYTVSNITIQHIEFPRNSVFLIPGTGIHLRVNEASATVTADWRFTTWLFRSSGKLIVYVRGMIISATATVSQDEAGHPMLFLKSCNGSVDNIDIQLDESSSINLEIQRINAELKQHQVRTQVDAYAVIDYSLVNLPSISHTSIDVDFKGTVYSTVNETEPSFEPDSFILPTMSDFMLYIGISEYFFHSASLAYYTSGAFEVSTEKEASLLENFMSYILQKGIIPSINVNLKDGIPLPVLDTTVLVKPVVTVHQVKFTVPMSCASRKKADKRVRGYLLISTDVRFKPSYIWEHSDLQGLQKM